MNLDKRDLRSVLATFGINRSFARPCPYLDFLVLNLYHSCSILSLNIFELFFDWMFPESEGKCINIKIFLLSILHSILLLGLGIDFWGKFFF